MFLNIKSTRKNEKNEVEHIIEVSAEEFDSAINEAFKKNRNHISVPGFRKGKAPRKIIERMYGPSIFHEDALENILPQVMSFAFDESETKLVGYPQVEGVDIKEEGGVDITIVASEYPEVKLGDYKGLSAVKPVIEVTDSEIDEEIEIIRLRNARIEKADRPAINGDTAVIDFEGQIDGKAFEGGSGKEYELELGTKTFIPGFEEKILGMAAGEERNLDLVFPDDYNESLAGKAVTFKVKLNDLKEKILPDVDDEFVKDVSEFDTLDEYRESIREKFRKEKQARADTEFENSLMEKIIDSMEADVPEVMVEEQLENAMNNFARQVSAYGMDPGMYLQMTNSSPEEFREGMRVSSEKQVRTMLALEKIAELEGIEVSEEEVENEYKEAAERFSEEIDKLKDSVPEETIKHDIKLRRAAMVVIDSATAEDAPAEDESKNTEGPANVAKPKKTPAKKPASQKAKPKESSAAPVDASETGDAPEAGDAKAGSKDAAVATAKKPSAKKTKPEAESAKVADAAADEPEQVKKPATKNASSPKTTETTATNRKEKPE